MVTHNQTKEFVSFPVIIIFQTARFAQLWLIRIQWPMFATNAFNLLFFQEMASPVDCALLPRASNAAALSRPAQDA